MEGRDFLASHGLGDADLRIAYCCMADERCWSILALANATHLSRPTVRAHLQAWVRSGYMAQGPNGYCVTSEGKAFIRRCVDDFLDIKRPVLRFVCLAMSRRGKD